MPKKKEATKEEIKKETSPAQDIASEVFLHYQEAKNELNTRITNKDRGFDVYDRIFRNFIDKTKWPFSSRVPDGRGATLLKRKTDRLLANRIAGKMIAGKGGTELKAAINTELIGHEWNEVDLRTGETMLSRLRKADLNARKYGAGFLFVPWRTTNNFDGPTVEPIEARNMLFQPGCTSVEDSAYVQIRRYNTLEELKAVNDAAKSGQPVYSKEVLSKLSAKDNKTTEYTSINKQVIGLSDNNAGTERLEVITEYRRDRWITFVPNGKNGNEKHILRDIPNPYNHGEIPIVPIVYDAIDDDIYGVPELENVLPLIKASWALISQYLDQAQIELMSPVMMNPANVQIDTIVYEAGARWFMNTPGADVVPFKGDNMAMSQFQGVYGLLTSLIMEGIGETGQDVSVLSSSTQDKTATEIKDMAMLRTSRDNANKLVLSQAISKVIYFWHRMNQQFITKDRLVRIVGKDAIKLLLEEGMHNYTLTEAGYIVVDTYAQENDLSFDEAYEGLRGQGVLDAFAVPLTPVGTEGEQLPKLIMEKGNKSGTISIGKEDLLGDYDYVVDIEAMGMPNDQVEVAARNMVSDLLLKTQNNINQDGFKFKWKEYIVDLGEKAKLKNMEQYFEAMPEPQAPEMATQTPQMGMTPTEGAMPPQESPQAPQMPQLPQ